MQLDWVPNYSENRLTFEIDNLRYTTVDGGQNIDKYIDGEFDRRIRQFPDEPEDWLQPHKEQPISGDNDEWCTELDWIIENYKDIVGVKVLSTRYRNREDEVVEQNTIWGQGANNEIDLVPVNRMGIPASVQERWDWTELAKSHIKRENAPFGLTWSKHNDTNEIIRHGSLQNCPCHVFPQIYVPVVINEEDLQEDVTNFGGQLL